MKPNIFGGVYIYIYIERGIYIIYIYTHTYVYSFLGVIFWVNIGDHDSKKPYAIYSS